MLISSVCGLLVYIGGGSLQMKYISIRSKKKAREP